MDHINNNTRFVIGLLVILVIVSLFYYYYSNNTVNNFTHDLPKKRYPDVVSEFGEPTMVNNNPGGFAVWNNKDYFSKIVLQDESIEHLKPKPHCDFLYATVNVYIPDEDIYKVLKLSQSIYYDNLKRELTARCHFMGANVATLYLAMMIINNPKKEEHYHTLYGPTIMSTVDKNTYTKLYNNLKSLVQSNQITHKSKMANKNCNIVA